MQYKSAAGAATLANGETNYLEVSNYTVQSLLWFRFQNDVSFPVALSQELG